MLKIDATHGLIFIDGDIPATEPHRHHAIQITVSDESDAITLDGRRCTSVAIDSNVPHRLSGRASHTVLVEPESHNGELLREQVLRGEPVHRDIAWRSAPPHRAAEILDALLDQTCSERHVDPRIADVLSWLDARQADGDWGRVSLETALRLVHLSEGRFLHLFREQTGVPWRRALIWRRAQLAMRLAASGATLTEAAHGAGYADSAHLSRQFKELFGLSPSVVVQLSQFLQAESDPSP